MLRQGTLKADGTILFANNSQVYVEVDENGEAGGGRAKPATNRSGTITTGGASQVLAAANPSRVSILIQNVSEGDLWVSEFGAATYGAGSFRIIPNEAINIISSNEITIIGGESGQIFTASEIG